MNKVSIRNCILGTGSPKIVVPLVAKDSDDLQQALVDLVDLSFDIIEFRADFFIDGYDPYAVLSYLKKVRFSFPDAPLLFTFRRVEEGGCCPCGNNDYFSIIDSVIESGLVDAVDIELFSGKEQVEAMIKKAKKANIITLLCHHDFEKTPNQETIISILKTMENLGADICKIALMPQTAADVLILLNATQQFSQVANQPIVTISMGKLGVISRLSGETFGSAMTFGAAKKASAPGQIEVNDLRFILDRVTQ